MAYQNYPIPTGNFFAQMAPEDEALKLPPPGAGHEWTETSMFGFNIPEQDIDCIIYHWHHPTLRITTGGIMIWRGRNTNQIECEYSDYRLAMPMPVDQTDCTYANGISIKMLRPLEEFEIRFADPARDTHLYLQLRAIMPPACRHNGGHMTQAMKTSGELILNGERHRIDGFHSRDRSWNEHRSEALLSLPPINWTVGIVDANFAFHHLSFDDPRHHPEWSGKLTDIEKSCLWGYVFDEGQTHGVVESDQRTIVDPDSLFPLRVEASILATNGRTYRMTGTAGATTQIQCWPNMSGMFALMRWDIAGKGIGYGDVQRCMWRDAYRLMKGKG